MQTQEQADNLDRMKRFAAVAVYPDETEALLDDLLKHAHLERRNGVHQAVVIPIDASMAARLARRGFGPWGRK